MANCFNVLLGVVHPCQLQLSTYSRAFEAILQPLCIYNASVPTTWAALTKGAAVCSVENADPAAPNMIEDL